VNADCRINSVELQQLLEAWGKKYGEHTGYNSRVDSDNSLKIDNADLQLLLEHWAIDCN
jgi:hypothetical protein